MQSEKERQAILDSIEHWEENKRVGPLKAKVYSLDCPLCNFAEEQTGDQEDYCQACPVQVKTGMDECQETPWERAVKIKVFFVADGYTLADWEEACDAEIAFLTSLLEPSLEPESPQS